MYLWKVSLAWLVLALLMTAPAFAHGGGTRVVVVDEFGNVISSRSSGYTSGNYGVRVVSPRFVDPRFVAPRFVPRSNVSQFNQNGGRNRIGPRR